jgi:AraC-like DNA-binding protein
MVGCANNQAAHHEPQASDTLYTTEAGATFYDKKPEKVFVILDTTAVDNWQHYAEMSNQLNKQWQEIWAHEYALRYQLAEEQFKAECERFAKKCISLIALSLGIILLVMAIIVFLIVRQLLSFREKNAVLAKEIAVRLEYEEKYNEAIKKITEKQTNTITDANLSTLTDSELFEYLRHIILDEKMYLNPLFDRQHLMDSLHLSKDRIGAAFAQGSQYGSLKNFLNEIRLQHSATLLAEHPEIPIAEVATASGFSNGIVFARNFKQRFTLTPTEYRDRKQKDLTENDE